MTRKEKRDINEWSKNAAKNTQETIDQELIERLVMWSKMQAFMNGEIEMDDEIGDYFNEKL